MSMPHLYDTFVAKNCTAHEPPTEIAGGQIVARGEGHAFAELTPLEVFANALVDGEFDTLEAAVDAAQAALDKASRQRLNCYQD
jgi:hypothetical protein